MTQRRIRTAVAVIAGITVLTSCTSGSSSAEDESADSLASSDVDAIVADYTGSNADLPQTFGEPVELADFTIGWSAARGANELVGRLGDALEGEVSRLGGDLLPLDANGDIPTQVTHMQQLINEDVDAIVVWPLDATALTPAVEAAHAAGIPVVAMEANPDGSDSDIFDAQVIFGRDMEAFVAASLMQAAHPGGQVATTQFAIPVPSILEYAARAEYWAEQVGLESVGTFDNPNDEVAGGQTIGTTMVSANPDLVGVLAYNDPTAVGVLAAARSAGRDLTVYAVNGGEDGLAAVRSGDVAMTIQPPLLDWARELIAASTILIDGSAAADMPATVFPGLGTVITADNVDDAQTLSELVDSEYSR